MAEHDTIPGVGRFDSNGARFLDSSQKSYLPISIVILAVYSLGNDVWFSCHLYQIIQYLTGVYSAVLQWFDSQT